MHDPRRRVGSHQGVLKLDLDFFKSLPPELNACTFGMLAVRDVVNLSLVCRWLCDEIARNDYIWRLMFIKTYQKEARFILMEGMDDGMMRTGWRRAFKLQFYHQVLADLCELLDGFRFCVVHTNLLCTDDDGSGGGLPLHVVAHPSIPAQEGGLLMNLYEWRANRLRVPLAGLDDDGDNNDTAASSSSSTRSGEDWLEEVGDVAEWDDEFRQETHRYQPDVDAAEPHEAWVEQGRLVRRFGMRFLRCLSRAVRGVEADDDDDNKVQENRDAVQTLLGQAHRWKERDAGCVRRLLAHMMSKPLPVRHADGDDDEFRLQQDLNSLPFDSRQVALEYVDALLGLFEAGEGGRARYLCLASQLRATYDLDALVLGVLCVSAHRAVLVFSMRSAARIDKTALARFMAEVDLGRGDGEGGEDEDEDDNNKEVEKEEEGNNKKKQGKDGRLGQDEGPWQCPCCTFINCDAKYACEICLSQRLS